MSENPAEVDLIGVAVKHLGMYSRMISGSKTLYVNQFPDNVVVFNANVCVADGKIWYGDLDVTKDEPKLKALAEELGERVYVLREMDGRFDNQDAPKLENAVFVAECEEDGG